MASRFGVGDSSYHHGTRPQAVDHVPFGAYPTALARKLGGWDEELRVNQDYEFDYRVRQAGYELLFDPALVIDWYCRQSIGDLWRQYRRYGRGKARMLAKQPKSVRFRHLAAPGLVLSWVVAAVLVANGRSRVATAIVLSYPVALAGASALAVRRVDDAQARRLVPVAFAVMHVGWGVGFWLGVADSVGARLVRTSKGPTATPSR
jgi:hypothetical protein